MIINSNIPVYGEIKKGPCSDENTVCQTIVNQNRKRNPDVMMLHIKNEGARTKAQMDFVNSMGFIKGASDYLLVGNPVGFMEVKRDNYSHKLTKDQELFLLNAKAKGAFVGVAIGWQGGMEFIEAWKMAQITVANNK